MYKNNFIFLKIYIQQGIRPATEDPINGNGAKWAMRDIPSGDIDNIWLSCLDKAIGDKCPHLNGIVTQVIKIL